MFTTRSEHRRSTSGWRILVGAAAVALALAPAAGHAAPQPKTPKALATFTVDRSGVTPVNMYTFKVPNGIKTVRFEVFGASGGTQPETAAAGKGGRAVATYAVAAGQVFQIVVGGVGSSSYEGAGGGLNGGGQGRSPGAGGGGASDVRVCANAAFLTCGVADRFVVAGGGGGGGSNVAGADGGGLTGNTAEGPSGGGGGTQTEGGAAGDSNATAGTFGAGGFADPNFGSIIAGGGGGWYGGGAGQYQYGGGGGSGHISGPALSGTMTTGVWSGDGKVSIFKG